MWLIPPSLSALPALASGCSTKQSDSVAPISASEPSLRLCVSGKVLPRPFSWRGWQTRPWSRALFGAATLPSSTLPPGVAAWIASLPASPASPGQRPASRKVSTTNAGSGPSLPESSETRNLRWCSSKTSPALFPGVDCITYSTTLPTCGSMRSGAISQQKVLALRTGDSACSSWPTVRPCSGERSSGANRTEPYDAWESGQEAKWPTPRGEDSESCGNHPDATDSLTGATSLWTSPVATERANRGNRARKNGHSAGGESNLADDVSLWATPRAAERQQENSADDYQAISKQVETWATPASRDYRSPNATSYQDRSDSTKGEQLVNQVEHHFLPPDQKQTGDESQKCSIRRLNPAFVCWLMGWPWSWTRPEPISFAVPEMALWRCKALSLLSSLCGGQD